MRVLASLTPFNEDIDLVAIAFVLAESADRIGHAGGLSWQVLRTHEEAWPGMEAVRAEVDGLAESILRELFVAQSTSKHRSAGIERMDMSIDQTRDHCFAIQVYHLGRFSNRSPAIRLLTNTYDYTICDGQRPTSDGSRLFVHSMDDSIYKHGVSDR